MARATSERAWWSGRSDPKLGTVWERIKAALHLDAKARTLESELDATEGDLEDLDWEQAEAPLAYGYAARMHYGSEHPEWGDVLEETLRREWNASSASGGRAWEDVRLLVRRGFDSPHTT